MVRLRGFFLLFLSSYLFSFTPPSTIHYEMSSKKVPTKRNQLEIIFKAYTEGEMILGNFVPYAPDAEILKMNFKTGTTKYTKGSKDEPGTLSEVFAESHIFEFLFTRNTGYGDYEFVRYPFFAMNIFRLSWLKYPFNEAKGIFKRCFF